jgi:periplasmic divalent cation tolerance protein
MAIPMPDAAPSPVVILSTASSHEEASRIAEALVAGRLAACVQLSPIESWYCWQGKIEHAPETRLQIKTMAHLVAEVEQRVRALHSYEVPEILVIPVIGGGADYLGWIAESIRSESG